MTGSKSPEAVGDRDPEGWREAVETAPLARPLWERRLKIRAWRRGTKEMDLILGGYFDAHAAAMSDAELSAFEALMREDDSALYAWVAGGAEPPAAHADVIAAIRRARGIEAE